MNVYLSIGNSDDKLTQAEWSQFVLQMADAMQIWADHVHGIWFSRPDDPWQNASWCLEFRSPPRLKEARETAVAIRKYWRQDSVAWAVADPEFI